MSHQPTTPKRITSPLVPSRSGKRKINQAWSPNTANTLLSSSRAFLDDLDSADRERLFARNDLVSQMREYGLEHPHNSIGILIGERLLNRYFFAGKQNQARGHAMYCFTAMAVSESIRLGSLTMDERYEAPELQGVAKLFEPVRDKFQAIFAEHVPQSDLVLPEFQCGRTTYVDKLADIQWTLEYEYHVDTSSNRVNIESIVNVQPCSLGLQESGLEEDSASSAIKVSPDEAAEVVACRLTICGLDDRVWGLWHQSDDGEVIRTVLDITYGATSFAIDSFCKFKVAPIDMEQLLRRLTSVTLVCHTCHLRVLIYPVDYPSENFAALKVGEVPGW
jgi:hypothetical protein